ncbi:MAG TPA: hypothetical protein EYO33_09620 [Phycisphaerales bacterium]|nr:hypothetical protein [Phycisphaerales bacterium]
MKKRQSKLMGLLLSAGLAAGTATAEPIHHANAQNPIIDRTLILDGKVKQMSPEEQIITMQAPSGAEVEVPLSRLGFYATGDFGFQELEPDVFVTARVAPGKLALTPAQNGEAWLMIGEEKFLKFSREDLETGLFSNQDVQVERPGGTTARVTLSDYLMDRMSERNL